MATTNNSWIKTYRSLLDWEWYQDIVTRDLFIHCLLKANYQNKTWKGIKIKKGSFITSSIILGDELGFSRQQIRRAIKNLKSTNEITAKATNRYTVIEVVKWGLYQLEDYSNNQQSETQDNQQATNKQPTNNQQTTTTKELKNLKKERSKEVKHKYGEYNHVLLTEKQYDKLKVDFPSLFKLMIKNLDEYIEMKGVTYKNHNLTLRKFQRDRPIKVAFEKEEIVDPFGNKYGSPEFDQEAYDNQPTTITY